MKTFLLIAVISTIALASCRKGAVNPNPSTNVKNIVGNWNLVSDSSYSAIGAASHTTMNKYIGLPGDHYNFTANGNLYIKVGTEKDTATYSVKADTLNLLYSYINNSTTTVATSSYKMTNFTGNTLTLSDEILTPGGFFGTVINLRKE
jgi:hypothetical protein